MDDWYIWSKAKNATHIPAFSMVQQQQQKNRLILRAELFWPKFGLNRLKFASWA